MAGEIRAVIDVGTNSVKLLVGEVNGHIVLPLHEGSTQTRLGEGFYETHHLQASAIRSTAEAIAEFGKEAAAWSPTRIRIIATSAARDAENKDELVQAISAASGLEVTIISGEQEADWAFRGVSSDPALLDEELLVMDVGGGSTEFILGKAGQRNFGESFRMGSVRLIERLGLSHHPTESDLLLYEQTVQEILTRQVKPLLGPLLKKINPLPILVATGGTSTILARIELRMRGFDRAKIEGAVLSHQVVEREKLRLWSLPLEQRKQIIGLPPNRADVILPGVVIFDQVIRVFGLPSVRVSTRGLRFAALMD